MIDELRYRAYLIRFQRGEKQTHWRVTLQNAQTGEVVRFANENQLVRFLLETLKYFPQKPDSSQPK